MTSEAPARVIEPQLHGSTIAVHAPALVLSAPSGDIDGGVHGCYASDRRVLSRLIVTIDDQRPEPVHAIGAYTDRIGFWSVARHLGDTSAQPSVLVARDRSVHGTGLTERVTVLSYAHDPVEGVLQLGAAADLAEIADVKHSRPVPDELACSPEPDGLSWTAGDGTRIRLRAEPAPARAESGRLEWPIRLGRGGRLEVAVHVEVSAGPHPPVVLPARADHGPRAGTLRVSSGDTRLDSLVQQGIRDVADLMASDPLAPEDHFVAAGAPWFLTLFGRDSIWAARMLLPLGTELAAGTLRTLARRQGSRVDPDTAEQPGKIMHELRRSGHTVAEAGYEFMLPPLYYGTVDATPLFVLLLHDAWRWGMPAQEVEQLLPAAERAVGWLTDFGLGPTGFVSYRDESGRGLANQGWKDSPDSIQFRDGRLAAPPIALCEVQAYSVAAANAAATLLDAFGRAGGDELRDWASALTQRFRGAFWVRDPDGDYPAIALDAEGRPVDSVSSNLGHLLGTGLLDEDEERLVVARLAASDLNCGFGLRTLSSRSSGYNPFAYHRGSVWTHDTAIAITGLAASRTPGARTAASSLISGLIAAAPAFHYRLPELYAGISRNPSPQPLAYPAACRPQAWAAASSVAILTTLLGLDADLPHHTIRVNPILPSPVGRLSVDGLVAGAERFGVTVDGDGVDVAADPRRSPGRSPGRRNAVNYEVFRG